MTQTRLVNMLVGGVLITGLTCALGSSKALAIYRPRNADRERSDVFFSPN